MLTYINVRDAYCVHLHLSHIIFRYGTGTLTSVFLDRVFQECLTYDGEMVGAIFYGLYLWLSEIPE